MAEENFYPNNDNSIPLAGPIWLEKGWVKKFQVGTPLTPNIAMALADGT